MYHYGCARPPFWTEIFSTSLSFCPWRATEVGDAPSATTSAWQEDQDDDQANRLTADDLGVVPAD
jgi:hypothetical protein